MIGSYAKILAIAALSVALPSIAEAGDNEISDAGGKLTDCVLMNSFILDDKKTPASIVADAVLLACRKDRTTFFEKMDAKLIKDVEAMENLTSPQKQRFLEEFRSKEFKKMDAQIKDSVVLTILRIRSDN